MRHNNNPWLDEQRRLLQLLSARLSGRQWLQLSLAEKPIIDCPKGLNLHLLSIAEEQAGPQQRLSHLAANSADSIICDSILQQHPEPNSVAQEIAHLLRPGGILLLAGAGSLRGRVAANISSDCPDLHAVIELLQARQLQLQECYYHGSDSSQPLWRQQLQQWQREWQCQLMRRLPSSLSLFRQWAALRPGWVLIFKDQRLDPMTLKKTWSKQQAKLKTTANAALRGQMQSRNKS